ncbi:KEOPS complex subunit Cgi121 [Methanomassiliicoccus luminyensis]|mgnify:CR=1 FL=1|jgi:KEOPS complex subunit Cgi121|uniref:KEOPS complex subunit Cgi121 n=1 Tax=Methanomassiliicoccus luminyensis TaxID=1080712 RepID=UPI0003666B11|nr:KEOPS complex subunit Cgi121 [Methanomassiliicoccus luminyensis]
MAKVVILGVRGQVEDAEALVKRLQGLEKGEGLALNADMVCGKDHLRSAVMHASRAFERGDNVCSSVPVETMLYASGERQISKAVKKMGVKVGDERVALVLFDVDDVSSLLASCRFARDDDVLEPSAEKAVRFGIAPDEIKAVPPDMVEDLVLERVAFVGILK